MEKYLEGLPRVPLCFSPTPLHKAERLSKELGIELWLKRDDLTGPGTFGGNKMRKLEFLLGAASEKKAEFILTYGATQSNHAMQTAFAATRSGMKSVLFLVAVVEPDKSGLRGNMLLDELAGATVNIVTIQPGETEAQAEDRAYAMGKKFVEEQEAAGHPCYDIPIGGSSFIGTLGFSSGYMEMREQAASMGIEAFDSIFHSTGSGGTAAGLVMGRALLKGKEKIISITCSMKDAGYTKKLAGLANDALSHIGQDIRVSPEDFIVDNGYFGDGYEIPSTESTEALKKLARTEGVMMDPVYTGKAFAGFLDYVRQGKIKKGERVLFWHTGGASSLFAEAEIVGSFS